MNDEPQNSDNSFDLTLLANFVHQIVNPLNGVAGTLDNLASGKIDQERRVQRLNTTRAQVEQCISLLRNLAFLAKGAAGIPVEKNATCILPQVIIESAMCYQEEGENKRIRISLMDKASQNRVEGRPELVRQVLMNLFDNCIKYGASETVVEVNQWIQSDTKMAIITVKSQSYAPVVASEMPRLFDLGFRGANAKQIIASGTGLGLYICKNIVESSLGGSLHVQSDGPRGILFTIKLPNGERG